MRDAAVRDERPSQFVPKKSGLSNGPEDSPMSWFTSQPLPLGDEAAKLTDAATRQSAPVRFKKGALPTPQRDNPEH
jgi:hypothetical protein